ncbi:OLC1v1033612C1 [Oldenlandia corymbosa var. corymbosa]|uniref:OLC1v1033612C1 n=1 Tax=Oldenlandia corymbosa var. corymbosa TaxID=529605 RepID=A0AAV1CPE3_OLDCO|nr:OLC1v1033612C1 [Oldenlandia corymbosa var. corymbosa]
MAKRKVVDDQNHQNLHLQKGFKYWWWQLVEGNSGYNFCINVVILVFLALLITVMYLHTESRIVLEVEKRAVLLEGVNQNASNHHHSIVDDILLHKNNKCDYFTGNWVFDNKSRPLYRDWNCSFMFDDLACEKYHREDLNYQYWRWQPNDCDLPRFDAKALLGLLRNKRLVFVGDSLNRNQWVSFVCMVESAIPPLFKSRKLDGNLYTFSAKEYNASIDFYWSPLLVESNSDDPYNHHLSERIVRSESIQKHAMNWSNADILVFNSYLWYRSVPKLKVLRGNFGDPKPVYKEVERVKGYGMALDTWSKFVLSHLDHKKTRLFWVSMSPTHTRPQNWGKPAKGPRCMNETQPTSKEELKGSESEPKMMNITGDAISDLKSKGVKIDLLNITQLSEYRKDGHPTVYRRLWRPLTKEQIANPVKYADCTHWCLPGVPDVWNEILYAYLLSDSTA